MGKKSHIDFFLRVPVYVPAAQLIFFDENLLQVICCKALYIFLY